MPQKSCPASTRARNPDCSAGLPSQPNIARAASHKAKARPAATRTPPRSPCTSPRPPCKTPGPRTFRRPPDGRLAQLARALARQARGHWFESSIAHQLNLLSIAQTARTRSERAGATSESCGPQGRLREMRRCASRTTDMRRVLAHSELLLRAAGCVFVFAVCACESAPSARTSRCGCERLVDSRSAIVHGAPDRVYARLSKSLTASRAPWNTGLDRFRVERRDDVRRELQVRFSTHLADQFVWVSAGRATIIGDSDIPPWISYDLKRSDVWAERDEQRTWRLVVHKQDTTLKGRANIVVAQGACPRCSHVAVTCTFALSVRGDALEWRRPWKAAFDNVKASTEVNWGGFHDQTGRVGSTGLFERRVFLSIAGSDLLANLQWEESETERARLEMLFERSCRWAYTQPPALQVIRKMAEVHVDLWGRRLRHSCDAKTRTIVFHSLGRDGLVGTSDDIVHRETW